MSREADDFFRVLSLICIIIFLLIMLYNVFKTTFLLGLCLGVAFLYISILYIIEICN